MSRDGFHATIDGKVGVVVVVVVVGRKHSPPSAGIKKNEKKPQLDIKED